MESRQLPDELNMSECDGAVIVSQLVSGLNILLKKN